MYNMLEKMKLDREEDNHLKYTHLNIDTHSAWQPIS